MRTLLNHFGKRMLVLSNLWYRNFGVGLAGWEGSLIDGGQPKVHLAGVAFLWDRDFGNLTAGCARPLIFLLWLLFLFKQLSMNSMSKSAPY